MEDDSIPGDTNDERLTDVGTTSFVPTSVSLSSLLPLTESALISWLIYKCSDTVEWRTIPGGSNDESLTDIDARNCYICNTLRPARLSCVHSHMPQFICNWKRSKNRECLAALTMYLTTDGHEADVRGAELNFCLRVLLATKIRNRLGLSKFYFFTSAFHYVQSFC